MVELGAIFTILEKQMMIYIDDKKERERERKKNDKMQMLSKKNDVYSTYIPRNSLNDIVSATVIVLFTGI